MVKARTTCQVNAKKKEEQDRPQPAGSKTELTKLTWQVQPGLSFGPGPTWNICAPKYSPPNLIFGLGSNTSGVL
jgi:hypothetical protein